VTKKQVEPIEPIKPDTIVWLVDRDDYSDIGQAKCLKLVTCYELIGIVGTEDTTLWMGQRKPIADRIAEIVRALGAKQPKLRKHTRMPLFQLTDKSHARYYGCQVWWRRQQMRKAGWVREQPQ